jgi:hypothetical protein
MPYPDDIFRAATAPLFGDAPFDQAASAAQEGHLREQPPEAASGAPGLPFGVGAKTEPAEALLVSPPQAQPIRQLTATERLVIARLTADLARRQVDAQPDAQDYP